MGFPERYALSTPAIDVNRLPRALSPILIWVVRMLFVLLICALSLAVLVTSILVVKWYNDHEPIVKPSWGSLIFLIVLSLLTPLIYAGYEVGLPLMPFVQPGDILHDLLCVKVEVMLQLAMCILWVSGTLAYFEDLGGRGACEFDSYYHYAIPDDFDHVCDLRDLVWPLAFSVFAVQVASFLLEVGAAGYTFLFLDQEVLNEPHYTWGRRAYDFQRGMRTTGTSRAARASRAKQLGYDDYADLHGEPTSSVLPAQSFFRDAPTPREEESLSSTSHSRPSFRRGGAYSVGTPSETSFRRGGAYSVATPSEESLGSAHEAGPYIGPEDPEAFASNRERGYALSVSSEAWSSDSSHPGRGSAHRRGAAYVEEDDDDDLPALGTRGRRAYLED